MAKKRNPDSNSVLQALLDLADRGMQTWRVGDLITKISTDPKLRADLQAAWNAHAYPDKALVYAQLAREQRLFTLTEAAYKVIGLLGLYCHQNGLIQARMDDISTTAGIGRSATKKAVKELLECGALQVERPSARHEAPIYRVNPALINKGVRRKADFRAYAAGLTITPDKYILNRPLELVIQTETVRDKEDVYNKMYLAPPGALKEPKPRAKRTAGSKADEQLPGQLSFEDLPEIQKVLNG